ncbi:MAG: hypothetical protein ACO22Z_03560 [Paracoccaceae bacterium]
MTNLPLPAVNPVGFLRALMATASSVEAARKSAAGTGCVVHDLGAIAPQDAAQSAALHAAGARALAATLARGTAPMLLLADAGPEGACYADALAQGLMGYERIFAQVAAEAGAAAAVEITPNHPRAGLVAILILPPFEVNRYWGS